MLDTFTFILDFVIIVSVNTVYKEQKLDICIDTKAGVPIYQQIVEQVKHLIAGNQLKMGEQIPAVREMARWLKVNPSTVARAYYDLKREGIVATSRRRGTIILGNVNYSGDNDPDQDRYIGEVDGHLWETLAQKSTNENQEATFALHLAHWRVQRSA
jgi:DNA-binding transcriptional regulator YhcF (GntR family)